MSPKPNSSICILIILVLTIFFLIPSTLNRKVSAGISSFFRPVSRSLVHAGKKIASGFSFISEISDLRSKNNQLTADLIAAKVYNSKLQESESENAGLLKQLDYKNDNQNQNLVLAEVVELDPTNFYDTISIDRGTADGVKPGMAVVSLGVLVGKIDQVFPTSAKVILITGKDSIVQVMLGESRTTGILRGGISGMTLEDIPIDTPVADNENIITSGLGGFLPKGIFVGNADKEISGKSDIFKTLKVISPIDFSKLERVFVVIEGTT
ncbi:MAG: rod shape-determining protein MreC [Candidatus Berkelbacteria bacterium]|nr:rod shape-determining protein MreC [Candidatus Berkelbacteria bacterium]